MPAGSLFRISFTNYFQQGTKNHINLQRYEREKRPLALGVTK